MSNGYSNTQVQNLKAGYLCPNCFSGRLQVTTPAGLNPPLMVVNCQECGQTGTVQADPLVFTQLAMYEPGTIAMGPQVEWHGPVYLVHDDFEAPAQEVFEPQRAGDFLEKAAVIMAERARDYDKSAGERSMARAVGAFNTVLGRDAMNESEGWLFMLLLKQVRQFTTPDFHRDSAEDGVAYSALLAESLATQDRIEHDEVPF